MYSLGSADGSSSSSGVAKCICCNSDVNITNVLDIAKVWPGHRLLPTENGMNLERKKIEMYCMFVCSSCYFTSKSTFFQSCPGVSWVESVLAI